MSVHSAAENGCFTPGELLARHPAVAEVVIVDDQGTPGGHARIVPDREAARTLSRSVALEAANRLGDLAWHEPADVIRVAGLNRGETDFLYREIFVEGAYFRHGITLPPRPVVLDVGANIGMFSLRVGLAAPGARVIAVEPVAELAAAVRLNAELHGLDVTVLPTALGRSRGETPFTFYPNNSVMSGRYADVAQDAEVLRGYLLTGDDAGPGSGDEGSGGDSRSRSLNRLVTDRLAAHPRRVPVATLGDVIRDHNLTRVDLLKIDVEKAEAEVLAGLDEEAWERVERVVVEVHDMEGRLEAVLELLRDRGFHVTHDQDPRLALTPCHNVYARRPRATAGPPPAPVFEGGPTLRRLEGELRELLARELPSAPPPGRWTAVPCLGPAPGATSPATPASPAPAAGAPERVAVLARVWTDLFGADAVRSDADFFDLGGDSLTAVRLLAQVEDELGPDALAPDLLFSDGTFAVLAAALGNGAPAEGAPRP
ncbi:FkbM family methyltransferase [Streptomyces sp. TBY4]|uniref:FkbM family methyltransferase n=1 Tax=Streptomyces sp. TBY4 TaxID=2962030 RepID=UPI0020B7EE90|nr:FkbM family methyltransferase [Streptomyces sp. TBY4]MCP3757019.1 FkbM family methyltransferase [Streptomyces sp. TBY4]